MNKISYQLKISCDSDFTREVYICLYRNNIEIGYAQVKLKNFLAMLAGTEIIQTYWALTELQERLLHKEPEEE
ncbi:MAG: hypothetical protein DDT19_00070 [Syntrophomonadaceae bacterium]|nr:hypothetical protein [Bacillota bacterium]